MAQEDRCAIIVKAQPHRSSNYAETVCCAGIGVDGKWRRQYPVPFRILEGDQKFRRWSWIDYNFVLPKHDQRRESQKVDPESIRISGLLKPSERAKLLNPIIREDFAEADALSESLTLLRPASLQWKPTRKSQREIDDERRKHKVLADQLSMIDQTARPLEPCPYEFSVKCKDSRGRSRSHISDDWESVGAFFRFRKEYGEETALKILQDKYEKEYFSAGLAFAFSTHSRRNVTYGGSNQWLLVGLIRLDETRQDDLFLGKYK